MTTQPPDPLTDLDALLTGVVTVDRLPFLLPVPPLTARVDLAAVAEFNAGVEKARAEYERHPVWYGHWPA